MKSEQAGDKAPRNSPSHPPKPHKAPRKRQSSLQ